MGKKRGQALDAVTRTISEMTGLSESEITPESLLEDDLGMDDLDMVEVEMSLEEEFGVEFGDDEVPVQTVGQLAGLLLSKVP